jgi:peptidoglycan hydrolase-like protein with peptidoglycan-binding domain
MQTAVQIHQPSLQIGFAGPVVKELQRLLQHRVSDIQDLKVDGIFSERTKYAVQVFQYRVFLKSDGIVDQQTWQALYIGQRHDLPELCLGSYGSEVARVQHFLKLSQMEQPNLICQSFYCGEVDKEFGPKTELAVKSFQGDKKLVVDGIIGSETWIALMAAATEVQPY